MVFWLIPIVVMVAVDYTVEHFTGKDIVSHALNVVDNIAGTSLESDYTSVMDTFTDWIADGISAVMTPIISLFDTTDYDWFNEWFSYIEELLLGLYDWMEFIALELAFLRMLLITVIALVCLFGLISVYSHRKTRKEVRRLNK